MLWGQHHQLAIPLPREFLDSDCENTLFGLLKSEGKSLTSKIGQVSVQDQKSLVIETG